MNAFFLALFSVLSYVHADCLGGLLAGYTMDDLSGLVLHDSTTLGQHIALNTSLTFSSSNNPQGLSALVFAGESALILSSFPRPSQFSVTLWFKTNDWGESPLFSWSDPDFNMYVRVVDGFVSVAVNTIFNSPQSTKRYNDDRWHFLVVCYAENSAMYTLYIDPHSSMERVVSNAGTARSYYVFQIGGFRSSNLGFVGSMDDFRVYNVLYDLPTYASIANQADQPCNMLQLIAQRALYTQVIPANAPTTVSLQSTQSSVCGVMDGAGRCANNRFGIAITACAGTIAGVYVSTSKQKDTIPSLSTCSAAYDGSVYRQGLVGVEPARLCMSASRILTTTSPTNPISAGILNKVTFTSGSTPLRVELSVVVADQLGSYNPTMLALGANNPPPVITCNGEYREARWAIPVMNNGLTCNSCFYQAWYVPLSKITEEKINLGAVCGVKLYGRALPDSSKATLYNQFVLPAVVPFQGDDYIWTIIASSSADGFEQVVAILDSCPARSASVAPTSAPTGNPPIWSRDDFNSNILVLNLLAQNFPVGPPRDGFTNQFVTSLAAALSADRPRFTVTSFTPKAADKVAVGFDIGPPVSTDNRSAGALAWELYYQHANRSSLLYALLPNTNPDPSSFSSNYEVIPNGAARGPPAADPFPWEMVVIIIASILGAICCCCLLYFVYHRCSDDKPRKNNNNNNHTRSRGVEIGTQSNHNKPHRLYDDEDKHTAHSDRIQFPQVRSPSRGASDLATTKRLATSPDTHTQVSYKGATLNSSDEGPPPHMDPRDWKTVVALHGRNGTVDKGDLVFKLGDVIRVVGGCDGPHWFEGELESTGQRGMVPVNHVRGQTPSDGMRTHRT